MENQEETVVLEIEGSPVKCRKKILIENSDYFSAMFKGSFKESSQKQIKIEGVLHMKLAEQQLKKSFSLKGVDLKSFNTILLLLWDASYSIDISEIHMVLQAACMLQFNTIKKVCEDRILQRLNPFICIEIWKTTEMLDISPLWLKAKSMALEEFMKICDSKSVLELSLYEICMYLGHIHLNVHNELSVFQTAINWWYENQEAYEDVDSTKIILRLLNCIDFKKLKGDEIKEMQTYPDIAENSEIISILNCVLQILGIDIEVHYEFSKDQQNYATHLCNSKSRQVPEVPCILLQTDRPNYDFPNKKLKFSEKNDKDVVIYDGTTNKFEDLFFIDGDKIRDLAGFKFLSYKEFVLFFGGEYTIGGGNWNFNVWSYDTIKEKWERKSVLPEGRRHFETVLVDNCIYIVGGIGKFRVIQENLIWYDFKSDEWSKSTLPYKTNHFKCCSVNNQLIIIYLSDKRAFIFNASLRTWRNIAIMIEKRNVVDMGDYTLFSDSQYVYVKGKHLIKFKLDGDTLVHTNRRVMKDIDYEEIESVLCNNIIYTLYKCLDEHYNFSYTFETFNLETEALHYVFRNKIQETDCIEVGDKLFYPIQYTKLFSMNYYYLVKENMINNFLP